MKPPISNACSSLIALVLFIIITKSDAQNELWKCDNGQNISQDFVCNGENDCADGSDETTENCPNTNEKYCSSANLTSGHSTQVMCKFMNEVVACDDKIRPQTKAYISCADGYALPPTRFRRTLHCGANGEWDMSLEMRQKNACRLQCAAATSEDTSQHSSWHVDIYRVYRWKNSEKICGGTIISTKLVLTATNCFRTHKYRASDYSVMVEQKEYNISNIRGVHDIAILHMATPFIFTNLIRPLCITQNRVDIEMKGMYLSQNSKVLINGITYNNCTADSDLAVQKKYLKYCLSSNEPCGGKMGSAILTESHHEPNTVAEYHLTGIVTENKCSWDNIFVLSNFQNAIDYYMYEDSKLF